MRRAQNKIRKYNKNNRYAAHFFDERVNTDYIDLDECAQNFADVYHKSFLNKTDLKCVGDRLLYGEYVYFEFYAKEHVQFFLLLKTNILKGLIERLIGWNFYTREAKAFNSLQRQLNSHGWTTLDLS